MSSPETERTPALTPLPSLDTLRRAGDGYDEASVREAFDAFRRHTTQLQAQLRVLQAARRTSNVEPTGHAVRMDALHLIRAAAEFADTLERDAQTASATQLQRTEEEVRAKQRELQRREAEIESYRQESERQRAEILAAAKAEARDLLSKANADATSELREAETRGNRLLEQSRHQATELTNAARAEVEQTLEWARAQATAIMGRAQKGAEQLLAAAGLGEPAISRVVESLLQANDFEMGRGATAAAPARPVEAIAAPPVSAPPAAEPVAEDAPPAPAVTPPPVSGPPPPVSPFERPQAEEPEPVADAAPPAPEAKPVAEDGSPEHEPGADDAER